ncbi:MAG: sugar phosphate isomerase/epimerase [Mesorhizobium sp.]|nr:sugar phosphate isomerase/epimerase [Mesorhizobium sp.]
MPFGINLLCLTDYVGEEHLDTIGRIREIGYDGVEVCVLSGDPDHYRWLGGQLDGLGLRRTTTSIVASPDADPTSADPEVRRRGVAHLDWALDCAVALGAESMGGPFHAPIGHFTGAGPTSEEWARAADAHRRLAERAASHGMILSLEPLNRFETHFLNTMEQSRAYIDLVGHSAFKIMYDTFHANIEERSQVDAIRTLGDGMGVLHISENDRGIPGRGHIDFPSVFRAAHATGFDGWVVMEAFGTGLPAIAAATRVWRPLFPDYETLFREGLEFMRKGWAEAGAEVLA